MKPPRSQRGPVPFSVVDNASRQALAAQLGGEDTPFAQLLGSHGGIQAKQRELWGKLTEECSSALALMGGPQVARMTVGPDGQPMQIGTDPVTGQQMALPAPGGEHLEQKIDIARIEGQVKASSVKRVAEFVDKHPEESVSIIRTWLHESA